MAENKLVLKIREQMDLSSLFPLGGYYEAIVAEGGVHRHSSLSIEEELFDYLNSKGLIPEVTPEDRDYYGINYYQSGDFELDELFKLAEQSGLHVYDLNGYSKGDLYYIVSTIELSNEYREELNSIVFGGNDWFVFEILEVNSKGEVVDYGDIQGYNYIPYSPKEEQIKEDLLGSLDVALNKVEFFIDETNSFSDYIAEGLKALGLKQLKYKQVIDL